MSVNAVRAPLRWAPLILVVSVAGCALQAPPYRASVDVAEQLKRIGRPMKVGGVSVAKDAPGASTISLRGNPMSSPVGADFAAYLAEALRAELQLAGLSDAAASVEIGGVLLKNDIAAGGIATNSGEIEARFTVRRDGAVRYEKTQRAEMSWESSFMGSVAVPKAQQQYVLLVQQLLRQLFSDAEFSAAVR